MFCFCISQIKTEICFSKYLKWDRLESQSWENRFNFIILCDSSFISSYVHIFGAWLCAPCTRTRSYNPKLRVYARAKQTCLRLPVKLWHRHVCSPSFLSVDLKYSYFLCTNLKFPFFVGRYVAISGYSEIKKNEGIINKFRYNYYAKKKSKFHNNSWKSFCKQIFLQWKFDKNVHGFR